MENYDFVTTMSDEALLALAKVIKEEQEERKKMIFNEKRQAVITALKDFKNTFPTASIYLGTICEDCGYPVRYDLMNFIEKLDFQ